MTDDDRGSGAPATIVGGPISRPRAGRTPSASKNSPLTQMPSTGRDSPPVARSNEVDAPGKHRRRSRSIRPGACSHSGFDRRGYRPVKLPVRPWPCGVDADLGERLGMRDRQRAQPHRVDELEDRGVRAHAEHQREDGDRRERAAAPEHARGVADVLPDAFDERPGCSCRRSPRGCGRRCRACVRAPRGRRRAPCRARCCRRFRDRGRRRARAGARRPRRPAGRSAASS